ncbi:MAG TPA: hypothetical protein VNL71_24820, partial [Chloroflexota bacterium]|nr:hypothetical protein [Chloroflexota bacterium]
MRVNPAFVPIVHALVVVATLGSLLSPGTAPRHARAARLRSASLDGPGSIEILTADPANPQVLYRSRSTPSGDIVEVSTDAGVQWTLVLAPTAAQPLSGVQANVAGMPAACRPANYTNIQSLTASGGGTGTLYIGASGTVGDYLDGGCTSAVGGLYASTGGASLHLGTDGLPYAQDPVGRTIRAYDIDAVTADPRDPGVIYVHASQGTGP